MESHDLHMEIDKSIIAIQDSSILNQELSNMGHTLSTQKSLRALLVRLMVVTLSKGAYQVAQYRNILTAHS